MRYDSLRVGDGLEQFGFSIVNVLKVQNGGDVAATITVIGGGPDGDHFVVKHVFVTLVDELMSATNEFQVVEMHELGRDFGPEEPTGPARTRRPRVHVFRIRPDQIAKRPLVRDFLITLDRAHLIQRFYVRREAAVNA